MGHILGAGDLKRLNDGHMNSLPQGGDIGFVFFAVELHIGQSSVLCQRRNFVHGRIDKYADGLNVWGQILHQLPNRVRADVSLAFGTLMIIRRNPAWLR